ncbi:MAG: hypothetical protein RIQ41_453 [Candidatus Parcubacteria bacterium]|jgi:cyclophilin family peptidyl-prolyl cis-trans isomerase
MDQDTKITLLVIVGLIVILSGIGIFLRSGTEVVSTTTENATSTGQKAQTTTTNQSSMSTTSQALPGTFTGAVITTNKGVIEISFATGTPVAVENFAKLAESGFYNGTRFHRVIKDFMIQGGDPLSKDPAMKDRWGTGGPGYTFKDEVSPNDQFTEGVIAMANSGPNTNGSQFFIVTAQAGTPWLAGKHTIFGKVTKGMDVARMIEGVQTEAGDRPVQDVIVERIDIR